jgi:hypothetical protein
MKLAKYFATTNFYRSNFGNHRARAWRGSGSFEVDDNEGAKAEWEWNLVEGWL